MEKVLYEYSFDFSEILTLFIPLIVGVAFFAYSVALVKAKRSGEKIGCFPNGFFMPLGFIVGPLCVLLVVASVYASVQEHIEFTNALKEDSVYTVEGYVENFYPMPYTGHDTEHFEIDGVYFEYTDFEITGGYNKSASHGGVVTENGQHLKIKYIETDYEEGENKNIILYIAEISEK